jgi:hypothetical protein
MPAADLPTPPARMLVNAIEFVFNGSRKAGPSGRWQIQLRNNGQDDHDLGIRNGAGRIVAQTAIIRPNSLGAIKVRLQPGTYRLFCGVADHEALGMSWRLIVRRPKVRTTAP